jgi:hypothetical protein
MNGKRLGVWLGALFAGSCMLAAEPPANETRPASVIWRFGAGAASRSLGPVKFNTGWYSQASDVRQFLESSSSTTPFGPATGYADRVYLDGFVFRDINTENPNSFLPGTTAYWGYVNDSQVQNGNLVFSGKGSSTAFQQKYGASNRSEWSGGSDEIAVPVIRAEMLIPVSKWANAGVQVSYTHLSDDASHMSSPFSGFQKSTRVALAVADIYDLHGIIPPLAPYTGVFDPIGPAPLIDNIPAQRLLTADQSHAQTMFFRNRIKENFSMEMHTFSWGPTFETKWHFLSLALGTGIGFNVVDWDAEFKEELLAINGKNTKTLRTWHRQSGDTDVLPSFYLQGEIGLQIVRFCRLTAFARYDWMNELNATVGRSQLSRDLNGQSIGGMLDFTF